MTVGTLPDARRSTLPRVDAECSSMTRQHVVRATVTQRVASDGDGGGATAATTATTERTRCFTTTFVITDTDECLRPPESAWRHRCATGGGAAGGGARCVNTIGGYECACAAGFFAEVVSRSRRSLHRVFAVVDS